MICSNKEKMLINNKSIQKKLFYYKEYVNFYYNKKIVKK